MSQSDAPTTVPLDGTVRPAAEARCIAARNKLNAVLHGEGAVIDDLESAVANAVAEIERLRGAMTDWRAAVEAMDSESSKPTNVGSNDQLDGTLTFGPLLTDSAATFYACLPEPEVVLEIKADGRIFWRGREVESDDQFRAAMMDVHRHFCGRPQAVELPPNV